MAATRGRSEIEPSASTRTHRDALAAALRANDALTAREISSQVSLSERDVVAHLEHLERSLVHDGEELVVTPPRCIQCHFSFEQRERRSRPSRCPRCKSERIDPARFTIRASR